MALEYQVIRISGNSINIIAITHSFYCDYLPFLAGFLAFRTPGLGSYLMRATASYLCMGLVVWYSDPH